MPYAKALLLWIFSIGQMVMTLTAADQISMSADVPGWAEVPHIVESIEEPVIPDRSYRIEDFGAVADDGSDALPGIRAAIKLANKQGGGRVVIGAGTWFCKGPIHLLSRIDLHLEAGAVLVFSDDPEDYLPQVLTRWEGTELFNYSPFIYAYQAVHVSITGEGLLDGNVAETFGTWRAHQNKAKQRLRKMGADQIPVYERVFGEGDYLRPSMIQFFSCTNVKVEGVSIKDSPFWVVHLVACHNAVVRGIEVESRILNNDGVDIESSSNVLVENSRFITGDDSIVIKSGRDQDGWRLGRPSERIVIRNNTMAGHNALAIGSEMSGGVRHVFMENNQLGAVRGALYFKSNEDRGGVVENIHIRNITVEKSAKPLIQFRTNYPGFRQGGFPPRFQNISIENVTAEETGQLIYVRGVEDEPIRDVTIRNVHGLESTLSGAAYQQALVIDTGTSFMENLTLEEVSLGGSPVTQK
ncbi:MAG: glycoside hydrolase family 28 protein [Opitutales bacterium]